MDTAPSPLSLSPIGYYHTDARYKYEQPRQGTCIAAGSGIITLNAKCNFEQALEDLAGFERIWIIYQFHQNKGCWRPTAPPPVPPRHKNRVGLFASRSPYRPNPIGLSCVILKKTIGRKIYIAGADLIDGTPVWDIKPYIPAFDAFPDAHAGWLSSQEKDMFTLTTTRDFDQCNRWIKKNSSLDPHRIAQIQLSINPFDKKRKRITYKLADGAGSGALSYRTWRIHFKTDLPSKTMVLIALSSGYTDNDLLPGSVDPHGDKELHRLFNRNFKKLHLPQPR